MKKSIELWVTVWAGQGHICSCSLCFIPGYSKAYTPPSTLFFYFFFSPPLSLLALLDSVWTNAILESSSASASALRNAADHSIWIGSCLRPSESLLLGRSQRFDCGGELYEAGLSSYTLLLAGSIFANISG
ncbi:hypothetical protein BDV34DRAFT_191524 [Aspergillus parasiticus]|uniref:Uncharacterized protein n=1 Tax=Aspergillus parasiticus TaxID=5067 RepID=A0A5N6DS18_ASPPA|nr:hypothetical protein BDV34DRAFT_191524 [Aspergillus parasiticus]